MATKTRKTKTSRLTKELLKTAHDMHKSGLLTEADHDKITMRHLGAADIPGPATAKISGSEIKAIREQAKLCPLSQRNSGLCIAA
jgi:putative transcriptional regulator